MEEILCRLQLALRLVPKVCRICSHDVTGEAAMIDHEHGDQHEEVAERRDRHLVRLGNTRLGYDSGWCDSCG